MGEPTRRKYRKRQVPVVAIRLPLESDGLRYQKWGAGQVGKPGDWLVDNGGDVYTVDAAVFERTYNQVERGLFVKTTPVWATRAEKAGSVATTTGETKYAAGDYLVWNDPTGTEGYAIAGGKFEEMYEIDPDTKTT